MAELYSYELERHALCGILQDEKIFIEVESFITDRVFHNRLHSTIFLVAKECYFKNEVLDKVSIANKIKNLNSNYGEDDLDIFDYVENFFLEKIKFDAAVSACEEIRKFYDLRTFDDTLDNCKDKIRSSVNSKFSDIINECDAIYGGHTLSFDIDDGPVQAMSGMKELLMDKEPIMEDGIPTPYPIWNRYFGGFKGGHLYAIISRPKHGKSTWLNSTCYRAAKQRNIKTLILDTEMSTEDTMYRLASARTGVPLFYLSTGQYKNYPDMVQKVEKVWDSFKKDDFYYHYHVKNKTIDEIQSIIRRWYFKEVGKGNECIVGYDYVKLTGETYGKNKAEHQVVGEKIQSLKDIADELNIPIITAMQQNRDGATSNKDMFSIRDDNGTASLTDRITWLASFIGIYRRKTPDELTVDGEETGSHKLIPLDMRNLGKDGEDWDETIRRTVTVQNQNNRMVDRDIHMKNYISFKTERFRVEEVESLRDIVNRENEIRDRERGSDIDPSDIGL